MRLFSTYTLALFSLASVFSATSHAAPSVPMPSVTMEFFLSPNAREVYTNRAFQTVQATCLIRTSEAAGNDVFVEVLRKKGRINDQPVSTGDNVLVHVFDKEALKITAEAAGQVALTNRGTKTIQAICTTN